MNEINTHYCIFTHSYHNLGSKLYTSIASMLKNDEPLFIFAEKYQSTSTQHYVTPSGVWILFQKIFL